MARENVTTYFKKLPLEFITEPGPLYSMMQWLTEQLIRIESESKVGAEKNKRSKPRRTYFSGYHVRRFDTLLGTICLMVPTLRNEGYVPFFVAEKKRSEQAMIQVVQEAFINGVSTRRSGHYSPSSNLGLSLMQWHPWGSATSTWQGNHTTGRPSFPRISSRNWPSNAPFR